MKIVYDSHYDDRYWTMQKEYHDAAGNVHKYIGPSLDWSGFELIADALASVLPKGSVLDVGCGGGGLGARLMDRGFTPYGVEISTHAIENCVNSMRGRIAYADITTCPQNLRPHGSDQEAFPDQFDIVIATDLLEHVYEEDLDRTFDWILSKAKRWMFFCVATAGMDKIEFVLRKGAEVPIEFESCAVSGHVNVRPWRYWVKFFESKGLTVRWDLGYIFQMQREMNEPWRQTMGWNLQTTWFLELPSSA